jgi:hypothetical protein
MPCDTITIFSSSGSQDLKIFPVLLFLEMESLLPEIGQATGASLGRSRLLPTATARSICRYSTYIHPREVPITTWTLYKRTDPSSSSRRARRVLLNRNPTRRTARDASVDWTCLIIAWNVTTSSLCHGSMCSIVSTTSARWGARVGLGA